MFTTSCFNSADSERRWTQNSNTFQASRFDSGSWYFCSFDSIFGDGPTGRGVLGSFTYRLGTEKSRVDSQLSTECPAVCDVGPGECPTPPQTIPHQKHLPVRGPSTSILPLNVISLWVAYKGAVERCLLYLESHYPPSELDSELVAEEVTGRFFASGSLEPGLLVLGPIVRGLRGFSRWDRDPCVRVMTTKRRIGSSPKYHRLGGWSSDKITNCTRIYWCWKCIDGRVVSQNSNGLWIVRFLLRVTANRLCSLLNSMCF